MSFIDDICAKAMKQPCPEHLTYAIRLTIQKCLDEVVVNCKSAEDIQADIARRIRALRD